MDGRAAADIELAANNLVGLIDRHLPDLLDSFTLVGSAVDGDYRPGRSDLDFVAVLRAAPMANDLDALTVLHRLYAGDPALPVLDGIWITRDELRAGPDAAAPGPTSDRGTFLAAAAGNRNPVTWITLRDGGRTILGALDPESIWHDRERLASWVRGNVDSYWHGRWLADGRRLFSPYGFGLLGGNGVSWGVLGISRMHYTLATGRIAAKSEAGRHAFATFDTRWHRIIEEALRVREGRPGGTYANPFTRRREALGFVAMAIEAIRRDYFASE